MTRFRPCIDLHAGQVKQIVGGTLNTTSDDNLKTNYVSKHSAGYYASLYRDNNLLGAHVIMLGPGNEDAAREALTAWPGHLQIGGGINDKNAREWIDAGAEKVIITSYLFPDGTTFSPINLQHILAALNNDKSKLVIDLSCRRLPSAPPPQTSQQDLPTPPTPTWHVTTNKWQTLTSLSLSQSTISLFSKSCSELLIHAADVEGLQSGIDAELVTALARWMANVPNPIPITYAGGARSVEDLDLVERLSGGTVDLTIGSALDVFGGKGARFEDCVRWNEARERKGSG